jgi:hypothetical protein
MSVSRDFDEPRVAKETALSQTLRSKVLVSPTLAAGVFTASLVEAANRSITVNCGLQVWFSNTHVEVTRAMTSRSTA